MFHLGLLGKKLSHSFSKNIFTAYFRQKNIDADYQLFELDAIENFPALVSQNNLIALNITFPYKTEIIRYLNYISAEVESIGAVNWIMRFNDNWFGFNTDAPAFESHIDEWIDLQNITKAIIIGNGGVAKAVKYIFIKNNIIYHPIYRKDINMPITYSQLDKYHIAESNIIVQCTPVGTFPFIGDSIPFPFELLNKNHFVYDMIYNPDKSSFLEKSEMQGAKISNGLRMLHLQAQHAMSMFENLHINKKPLELSQRFYKIR